MNGPPGETPPLATSESRRIAITGANGYVGRHLVDAAIAEGWRVVALTRRPPPRRHALLAHVAYDLESAQAPEIPDGLDVLVHLAARTNRAETDDGVEERAAELLLQACSDRGVPRFLFASSQTARPDAPSVYGRVKSAIEERVLRHGGTVVRAGMVCGGDRPGGLYAALSSFVARAPLIPRLVPGPSVQPIYVGDLCRALLGAIPAEHARVRLSIAEEAPLPFHVFLQEIARHRFGRRLRSLPVPTPWLATALGFCHRIGRLGSFTPARLASLTDLDDMDTGASLRRVGARLTPLGIALGLNERRRRHLLREGRALLRYVGGPRRSPLAARDYVRALEAQQEGVAWDPASRALSFPCLMAGVERRARRAHDLRVLQRFDIALAVAEARGGYDCPRRGVAAWFVAVAQLSMMLALEAVWRGLTLFGRQRSRR